MRYAMVSLLLYSKSWRQYSYSVVLFFPTADGSVDMLWSKFVGSGVSVVGQIIGVNDNMLIAQGYDGDTDTSEIIGIRIS